SIGGQVGFRWFVIPGPEPVCGIVIEQRPRFAAVLGRRPLLVPLVYPWRVTVVVKGAGNELAGFFGEPESLARVAGQRHRAAVLDRHTEDFGSPAVVNRQLVAERRDQDRRR